MSGTPTYSAPPIEPTQPPEPEVHPSSTPSGPSTIPTPPEPQPDPESTAGATTGSSHEPYDVTGSDPAPGNNADPEGGWGLSSERPQPRGDTIEGTGSHGSAVHGVRGTGWAEDMPREQPDPEDPDADPGNMPQAQPPHPQAPAEGPDDPDYSGHHGRTGDQRRVDRTVGESNTAAVPSHGFDSSKNLGHGR